MIKHMVLFRFEDEVPEQDRRALLDALDHFPQRWPDMQGWSLGENISNRDDRFTHAFVVEFEDESTLFAYLSSEEHERFVRERWRPVIAERAIVSFAY